MNGDQKKFSNVVDAFSESDMSDVEEVAVDLEKSQDCCNHSNQKSASVSVLVNKDSVSSNQGIGAPKELVEEKSLSDSDDIFLPMHKAKPKNPITGSVTQGVVK